MFACHLSLVTLRCVPMGGDNRLPQTYAAVPARDFGVSEHLEALRRQALFEMIREKTVLERPATQANSVEPGSPAHQFRRARQDVHKSQMKSMADNAGRDAFAKILGERLKHGARVDDPSAAFLTNCKRITHVS